MASKNIRILSPLHEDCVQLLDSQHTSSQQPNSDSIAKRHVRATLVFCHLAALLPTCMQSACKTILVNIYGQFLPVPSQS